MAPRIPVAPGQYPGVLQLGADQGRIRTTGPLRLKDPSLIPEASYLRLARQQLKLTRDLINDRVLAEDRFDALYEALARPLRADVDTREEFLRALQRGLQGEPTLPDDDAQTLDQFLAEVRGLRINTRVGAALNRIGGDLATRDKNRLEGALGNALRVRPDLRLADVDTRVRAWATENTERIGDLSDEMLIRVRAAIVAGVANGTPKSELRRQIRDEFVRVDGVEAQRADNRAKLLAQDQTGTLRSQLEERRQRQLGLKRFRWRTSADSRVRSSHRDREGEVFRWDRSIRRQLAGKGLKVDAIDGAPGRPIRCRCWAEPVLDDIEPAVPQTRARQGQRTAGERFRTFPPPTFRQSARPFRQAELKVDFVRQPFAENDNEQVVIVDVSKLYDSLIKNPAFFVGPGGQALGLSGRVDRFKTFLVEAAEKQIPVQMSRGTVFEGEADIIDGRHRIEALRQLGLEQVPISVDRESAKEFRRKFGAERSAYRAHPRKLRISCPDAGASAALFLASCSSTRTLRAAVREPHMALSASKR